MRILFILHQFFPEFTGGTESVTFRLAKSAQRAGHHVRIFTCKVTDADGANWRQSETTGLIDSVYAGVPVTAISRAELDDRADYSLQLQVDIVDRVCHLLEREQYDVCHVMHTMRMASAVQAVQNYNIPYILTLTDFFLQCYRINLVNLSDQLCSGANGGQQCVQECQVFEWPPDALTERSLMANKILGLARVITCPSEYVATQFKAEYPEHEFRVIPHGIDLSAFGPDLDQQGRVDGESLTFGYLGSIGPAKGLDLLIRGFRQVESDKIRLKVFGDFFENREYESEIRGLVEGDQRIDLLPSVPHDRVFSVLQSLDALCVPSQVPETFSLVLHEAGAAGVPALVSSLGAPQAYVSAHGAGKIVTSGDVDDWARNIRELQENPARLSEWRDKIPLPLRAEEEAFFYQSLYNQAISAGDG
jgi:glycosyltransferase involved in cell wall biosynthesis